jgi:hypothetical protein
MSIALATFMLLDLVSMYNRFFKKLDSIERIKLAVFAPTNTAKFLQNDKSIFRVFPYEADIFTSNYWSYFFQSVGGYNPAKLRIYQDVIESGAGGDSPLPLSWNVINMLNSKYVISKQKMTFDNLQLVNVDRTTEYNTYLNRDRLPRAFFIGSYIVITEKEERLRQLNDPLFDPGTTAILEKNLPAEITQPDSFLAKVTDFTPNHLELGVFTDKNALLVLSEIYYPVGWTAYIDDRITEIYKTNHILRSIYVPQGNHDIQLVFAPRSSLISIISKATIFIYASIMLIYFFYVIKRRRKE